MQWQSIPLHFTRYVIVPQTCRGRRRAARACAAPAPSASDPRLELLGVRAYSDGKT